MRAPLLHIEPVALTSAAMLLLAERFPQRYPVLLDSAAKGALSRCSILAALPRGMIWLDAHSGQHTSGTLPPLTATGFLPLLDEHWKQAATRHVERPYNLPFGGGWMVYLGYELGLEIEASLRAYWPEASRNDPRPVACALRVPAGFVIDESGQGYLVAEPEVTASERALLLQDLQDALAAATAPLPAQPPLTATEEAPNAYMDRVARAQEYILAGDIYQANLSRYWRTTLPDDFPVAQLYRRLRTTNPAPFAAFAQFGEFSILSSSPERLLRVRGRRLDTRPIAGTHPRGKTEADDLALAAALIAHPKERAEHVMLIDLSRNDLGRVSDGGSVRVDEYMAVETYAHVHHIVSNVTGQLRDGVSPIEALRAVFPGGTITGCPKVRCMQIIAELEQTPRGPYTGSLGYLNHDGSGDFNILIRTMSLYGRQLEFRAGAGIVADSRPERELDEARTKARGMLLALTP
jgi:anthranilate synthase component I